MEDDRQADRDGDEQSHQFGVKVGHGATGVGVGEAPEHGNGREPGRRDVTKVDGLPYRPRALPWPRARDALPMTFVAQFRFVESRDIVREVPGDLMLVFMHEQLPLVDDPDAIRIEWFDQGLTDLVTLEETPPPAWVFPTCYGVRHRTCDYEWRKAETFAAFERFDSCWMLAELEGTKIGGRHKLEADEHAELYDPAPGDFLCSLGSIEPASECPYPWVNVRREIPWEEMIAKESLSWSDAGIISFFWTEAGQVEWLLQSY